MQCLKGVCIFADLAVDKNDQYNKKMIHFELTENKPKIMANYAGSALFPKSLDKLCQHNLPKISTHPWSSATKQDAFVKTPLLDRW